MIIQWCCKGLAKLDKATVIEILGSPVGLMCQDWLAHERARRPFPITRAMQRLTEANLRRHVNDFSGLDPRTGRPFCKVTPFISLSAGCVDRVVRKKTNRTYRAVGTALSFATIDYTDPARPPCPGWVFYCYVVVGSNPAVRIPTVAEEVRELNHSRAFSGWYWQGEVVAKLNVPSTQILGAERYEPVPGGPPKITNVLVNLDFCHPAALLAERGMV
jgi:hypothetical protein